MENATAEELQKLSAMKLTVTFFTAKLENFITETNATDQNLLVLLSHLTDCIQSFVLAAKIIQTNHTIESVIDKSVLTCENIFECLACNVQTGKTFNSLLNHISTTKHAACAKKFEKQKKQQITSRPITMNPNNSTNPMPALPPFPLQTNRDYAMNINQSVHQMNPPFPPQNHLMQNPSNLVALQNQHLSNQQYQPVVQPPPRPTLVRPMVLIDNRPPISANQMHPSIVNNNISPMNGIINNLNQFPPPIYFSNYKELFRMPPPINVVGFQNNVVSPSNEFLRSVNPVPPNARPTDESNKQSHVGRPPRGRRERRVRSKRLNNRNTEVLDDIAMSFLQGNFEHEVTQFIESAEKFSGYELYADIITNLKESCRQLGLNAEVKCFGSRIIGIGSAKSDIDLNVSVTDCNQTTDKFLQSLLGILTKDAHWRNGIYINSRVALVRARYVSMGIDCDITFNNELAMANTKLIKYFYNIQPECQKLVVFMRMLTEKVKLYPQINTYTINLLVFFYLQTKGYLPKVMDLVEESTLKYWPNKFATKSLNELNIVMSKTFKDLCLGFLNFYANVVDFDCNVLSTFTGSTIPKGLFGTNEYRKINDCFNGLLLYMEENTRAAECIRTNFKMAMCVQDPFSHDHNVSRCVGKLNLKRFKECCSETYGLLRFKLSENNC